MYLPTLVSVYKLIDVTGHGQIALEDKGRERRPRAFTVVLPVPSNPQWRWEAGITNMRHVQCSHERCRGETMLGSCDSGAQVRPLLSSQVTFAPEDFRDYRLPCSASGKRDFWGPFATLLIR